ncbi:Retrovirus-related Pol polyprotein from transposon TNT 1-94 [Melia azedarach]|uniref:Retrovirus-related Pol polyprotein from transposon TNT 1-94 n=1 Tax=Melia azedarach TaxID=155640 RepID=A0ACC1X4Z1_MELAZ|nr:Retrovirus-related Pol polyprotein from transposon TNT 1-94 [Melia azedarach]
MIMDCPNSTMKPPTHPTLPCKPFSSRHTVHQQHYSPASHFACALERRKAWHPCPRAEACTLMCLCVTASPLALRRPVTNGTLSVAHVSSHNQLTDLFTKPLAKARFNLLRSKIGIADGRTILRGYIRTESP